MVRAMKYAKTASFLAALFARSSGHVQFNLLGSFSLFQTSRALFLPQKKVSIQWLASILHAMDPIRCSTGLLACFWKIVEGNHYIGSRLQPVQSLYAWGYNDKNT